jgi:hypothetical protein
MSIPGPIVIPRRVLAHIEGTSLGQDHGDVEHHGYGRAGMGLIEEIHRARVRKDGSVSVYLDRVQCDILLELADDLVGAAGDDAGPDDPGATADLNAGRAMIRRLAKVGVTP